MIVAEPAMVWGVCELLIRAGAPVTAGWLGLGCLALLVKNIVLFLLWVVRRQQVVDSRLTAESMRGLNSKGSQPSTRASGPQVVKHTPPPGPPP